MSSVSAAYARDRTIVLSGLAGLCLLCWLYLLHLVWRMEGMTVGMTMAMPQLQGWTAVDALLSFVMWVVMMVGMMVPTAIPMIMVFTRTCRNQLSQGQPLVLTSLFVFGYVAVWSAYSLFAVVAQWGLQKAALLSPTMLSSTSPLLGGVILVAAGVFQWTPLKERCLTQCRSPLNLLLNHWRDGRQGALLMGVHHGLFCLGCCWALMGVMFVTGLMNLLWMALLAGFMLLEKVAPLHRWLSSGSGLLLVGWGVWLMFLG